MPSKLYTIRGNLASGNAHACIRIELVWPSHARDALLRVCEDDLFDLAHNS